MGAPQRWWRPQPEVTMSVCPSGCVCQSLRAQGSNVTYAPPARAGGASWNSGSIRTVPVKCSAGPTCDGCEPLRLISMWSLLLCKARPFARDLENALGVSRSAVSQSVSQLEEQLRVVLL